MNYNKSTLLAYSLADSTVPVNGNISFDNSQITGCSIKFSAGASQITLSCPGLYQVLFDADSVTGTGAVTAQLYRNGTAVQGAVSSSTLTADETGNLNFDTIINVERTCCGGSDTTLAVLNTGVEATYNNTSIIVIKLA